MPCTSDLLEQQNCIVMGRKTHVIALGTKTPLELGEAVAEPELLDWSEVEAAVGEALLD